MIIEEPPNREPNESESEWAKRWTIEQLAVKSAESAHVIKTTWPYIIKREMRRRRDEEFLDGMNKISRNSAWFGLGGVALGAIIQALANWGYIFFN